MEHIKSDEASVKFSSFSTPNFPGVEGILIKNKIYLVAMQVRTCWGGKE